MSASVSTTLPLETSKGLDGPAAVCTHPNNFSRQTCFACPKPRPHAGTALSGLTTARKVGSEGGVRVLFSRSDEQEAEAEGKCEVDGECEDYTEE